VGSWGKRRSRSGSVGRRIGAVLGALLLLLILGSVARIAIFRDVATAILTPPQALLRSISSGVRLPAENARLRRAAARLALENFALREAGIENARLRRMIEFSAASQFRLEPAVVIARDAGRFGRALKVARGARAGIRLNMPVVNDEGLVGKVIEVDRDAAFVQPLLDPDCRVSAHVQRTRAAGILLWESGSGLRLADVPHHADVEVGDLVVTSGLGEIFPKGILIGRVTAVAYDEGHLFRQIDVEPFVGFSRLEEVFIVTGTQERPALGPPAAWERRP
jgi:rod shape-determining protein MreC